MLGVSLVAGIIIVFQGRLIQLTKEEYSTVLTGSGFMMYEFKQVTGLKLEGFSNKEIREKVIDENLFQYQKTSSLRRALPYLLRRIDILDDELRRMVLNEEIRVGKAVNFYSIIKTNRLFFEFMTEVILERLQEQRSILEKKDVNVFFINKEEQSEFINSLSETTKRKLQNVFLNILIEAGMLKDLKTRELRRLLIDEQLKYHLIRIGDAQYLQAMGEDEGL